MIITNAKCPDCGAVLDVKDGAETVTCPYDGIIEKNFYSAPSGYYYAIVTLRVKDSTTGRSESTTQYTGTVHI